MPHAPLPHQPFNSEPNESDEHIKDQVRGLLHREVSRREAIGEIGKTAAVAYSGGIQAEKGIKGFFRELLATPETTANYTIDMNKVAFAGNRLIFMSKVDGHPEEHLVIMDIDFLDTASSLGKDIGKLPLNVNSVSVLGDKLAAGGTQLNDSTKGLVWYSLHGGSNPVVLSSIKIQSETGQSTDAGPVQRVSIPIPPPGQWYLQNNVIFESSNPTDPKNIPVNVGVLDTNTGVVTPLSGSPASYVEGNMLAINSTSAIAVGINRQNVYIQAGYTAFRFNLDSKTITSTVNTEGANNMWLEDNIIQYFRESDNKRVTLTFNGNTRPTGTMNYNVDDKLLYSIPLNIDDPLYNDPVYKDAKGLPRPSAGAEGKKLYIAVSQQDMTYDPTIGNHRRRSFLVEIDPANGYDNVSKQKIIGSSANGLPDGVAKSVYIVKDGEGGDIPVVVYNDGIYVQDENGNFVKIQIKKKPKYRVFLPMAMVRRLLGW